MPGPAQAGEGGGRLHESATLPVTCWQGGILAGRGARPATGRPTLAARPRPRTDLDPAVKAGGSLPR